MADRNQDIALLTLMRNRLGYGWRAEEFQNPNMPGPAAWLDQQLAAPAGDDPEVTRRLAAVTLPIKYDAAEGKWPAVNEMRPITSLAKPIEDIWPPLFEPGKQINPAERGQPRLEVITATIMRAVYSRYQLREVMTQFWHDHFHVNAFSADQIAVALPAYDRDVIRKHTLGNFREMLEAVATSAAMQYYLSNHSSRAGAANENYARELFELHTLGRDAYLNDHYDRWREVPGALSGHPEGYIDEDVYEAARAFTGWTVEDGTGIDGQRKLPLTGRFTYVENWHDGYQKRVLATEFDPFAKPMEDGRKVLDLVAEHPATAQLMAKKLCRRIIGPKASPAIVAQTAEAWTSLNKAHDQIAQVVKIIAHSPEFAHSAGNKVKRPLALAASYARAMGYDFKPSPGLFAQMANAGQMLFGAPTPTGLADNNELFLGVNAMRQRWQLLLGLSQNAWQNGVPDADQTLRLWGKGAHTTDEYVTNWLWLFNGAADPNLAGAITTATGLVPFAMPSGPDGQKHLAAASALAAISPVFQTC